MVVVCTNIAMKEVRSGWIWDVLFRPADSIDVEKKNSGWSPGSWASEGVTD